MGKLWGLPPNRVIDRDTYYAGNREIISELEEQSDRGAAIVGVALLDHKLRLVLEATFDPSAPRGELRGLFEGPTAPLGSYSAKARLGRLLGLYGEQLLSDLKLFGRIRNRFAHDLDIRDFTHPSIAPLCEQLLGYRVESVNRDGNSERLLEYSGPEDARSAFLLSVQVTDHVLLPFAQSARSAAASGNAEEPDLNQEGG